MKKLKNKIAFVLLFILVSAMSQAKGLDPRFQILPLPQNIEILLSLIHIYHAILLCKVPVF